MELYIAIDKTLFLEHGSPPFGELDENLLRMPSEVVVYLRSAATFRQSFRAIKTVVKRDIHMQRSSERIICLDLVFLFP